MFFLSLSLSLFFLILELQFFSEILTSNSFSINLGFKFLNPSIDMPLFWTNIKYLFIIFSFISKFILLYFILSKISHKSIKKQSNTITSNKSDLSLLLGKDSSSDENIFIPEKGLYQNILITGSIGSGKTSSAMYPLTEQLIKYKSNSPKEKLGMLILDVKGNYCKEIHKYSQMYGRENDLITIELSGKYSYNPLQNPSLKPSVIANRLKTILLLFSPNNTESYWIDKSETVLTEAIKLCRLYNNGYVNFIEIHKLITDYTYYTEKINLLHKSFINNNFSSDQISDLYSSLNFFEHEFFSLDSRTKNILKSEITRITNCFISDSDVIKTFCPEKENNNFIGFNKVINSGKIVVLNMNINEFRNLSKIIATYLKLDFQTEVLKRLSNSNTSLHPVAFISDEYSEYVSATDANFFSQSREAKCINIVSTQSYTSLLNALGNKFSTEVIIQNLVNKLWFRSDDSYTIENAQKQLRKKRN